MSHAGSKEAEDQAGTLTATQLGWLNLPLPVVSHTKIPNIFCQLMKTKISSQDITHP